MAQSMENKVGQAADQAKNQAQGMMDKAKDAAGNLTDQASTLASSAATAARDAAGNVRDRATQGAAAVAGGMQNLAGTLREHAGDGGVVGTASATAADTLERGAQLLQQQGLENLVDDLGNMIRRNPVPAVLVGIGIGFCLGRMMRS